MGNDRFENRAMLAGAAVNARGRAETGVGVIAADFGNDDDLLLTHNILETNTLDLNNGAGQFVDGTNRFGLGSSCMPLTGFGLS